MKERKSWLPPGGKNLFQDIKDKSRLAELEGIKIIRLSIGQPSGPALLSASEKASQAILERTEAMHEYQDNGSPGVPGFAEIFVQYHVKRNLKEIKDIAYLPAPGLKSMFGPILYACGSQFKHIVVGTHTAPGYPTPADICNYYGIENYAFETNPVNDFRFDTTSIKKGTDLLMVNFPHNPSGQIATREWWEKVCDYCEKNGIRIYNDEAYGGIAHSDDHCSLADVAPDFPNLSWAVGYSASKLIGNGTGWRIAAMAGSPDFVKDIATIKGNIDSGFVAPMAVGVKYAIEHDQEGIEANRNLYKKRIDFLIETLKSLGMKLAVVPGAGFFTLWNVPKMAFGELIKDAEHFNNLMIENTGVVGVPFDKYIRFAVTSDVMAMKDDIISAFEKADVSY